MGLNIDYETFAERQTFESVFFKFWEPQFSAISKKSDFEFITRFMISGGRRSFQEEKMLQMINFNMRYRTI